MPLSSRKQHPGRATGPALELGSRIHLPNKVILTEVTPRRRSANRSTTPRLAIPIFPAKLQSAHPISHRYLGLQTYRILVRVTRSAEGEKPTAQRTFPRGRTDGGSMQRAGARETRTCLWGGGGERGRVAESWDNRTRRNCVAPKRSPHPSAGDVARPRARQPTRLSGSRPCGFRRAS